MVVIGPEIQSVAGTVQLCVRQRSVCEAAVHAMKKLYSGDSEGVLLVDASNAFNSLNRRVMLHNIQRLCRAFATCVINYYRSSVQLFVGGETLLSAEGTTQGDPLSMAIYALGTLPLVSHAKTADVTQAWFADDASAADKLIQLHKWWTILAEVGPRYGYFVHGRTQESRRVGSFCFQADQNVLGRSPSSSRGSGGMLPRGKFWKNGAKSCNFMHSGSKNRVIAAWSAHKKCTEIRKKKFRSVERTL